MEKGFLSLVLHSHLPYVRHPEFTDTFEEDWLFEAITETYLPLLNVFENLVEDNVDFRVTIGISPTLMEMLHDKFLIDRYSQHLEKLIELAEKEVRRTASDKELNKIARIYLTNFTDIRHRFKEIYLNDILKEFAKLHKTGKIEVIMCAATHGFLPLMNICSEAVRAQIKIGANNFAKHMGFRPRGIWIPECGYYPGLEEILKEEEIKFFFTDSHGLLYAKPRPRYGVYAPVYCPGGVACFGRDPESSKQVWSSKEGYPGDYSYRDFYRDIGYDLDLDYIGPYIHESGQRVSTGIKYYKITGDTDDKKIYSPKQAQEKAALHAGNFMFNREKQAEHLYHAMGIKPIIVAPYDAELFGHWWYEGPSWIDYLCRKIHFDQGNIKMITPLEYLQIYPKNQIATPCHSSWGYKGYNEVWLDECNDWIYRHLHKAAFRMVKLAKKFLNTHDHVKKRALNQAARELVLAQSSDWAFIMKTGSMVEYAHIRTKEHISNFTKIYEGLQKNWLDEGWLSSLEEKNNIFSEMDYTVYAKKP